MAFGKPVPLVPIWALLFFLTAMTNLGISFANSDPRIREVTLIEEAGQTIECPGQSRIQILIEDLFGNSKNCGNEFYEFYASRRCTFKRKCEVPRFDSSMQRGCPDGGDVKKTLQYKCTLGKEIIRMAKFSPNQPLAMTCSFDTSIHLIKATDGPKAESCYYKRAFEFIEESCRYKKMCEVRYESIPSMWRCGDAKVPMEIDYTCQNYSIKVISAIKGEPLTIQCPADYMIDVQSANYTSGTGKCYDPLAELTVIHKCSTKNRCSFPDDVSKHFMNLCFEGQKRLEIAYNCIRVEDTKKFLVFQNGMLDLACKWGQVIQIVSVKYGNDEKDCWTITSQQRMITECEGKTKCCASANDEFLGTSCCPKNVRKSLTVIYQCQAITNLETLENTSLAEKAGKVCESIRFELAGSFGKLTSDSIKTMDKDLLVMIGGSLPKLKQMSVETFDDVVEYMKNIEFLRLSAESYTSRADSFNDTELGIKDYIDRENVKFHAISWYRRLVGNGDILSEAQIDIDELSDLVTTVGASAHSLRTSVFNREGGNQTVVDMAILRFPDFKNPFFLIYNIKLNAWWRTSRLLIFEKARSGMSGQFRSYKFLPNFEFIRSSKKELIDKALNEVNSLFDMPNV